MNFMSTFLRVLILETGQSDAERMVHELLEAGFEPDWQHVETEAQYVAALEQAGDPQTRPDVILANYTLPQFEATQALRLLKERGLDIPFIVVSGTGSEQVATTCIEQGAADYLPKDRLARLGRAVRQAIRHKQLQDQKLSAEAALRESEERYRHLMALSPDGIAIHSNGGLVFINSAGAKMLGTANPELLIGRSIFDFVHPDYCENIKQPVNQVEAGLTTPPVEEKFIRLDGSPIDVEVVATSFTHQGKQAVQVVFRDIRERKRTEAEVVQRNRELVALQYAGATIASSLDLSQVLDTVTREMVNLLNTEFCIISEWNEAENSISAMAMYGPNNRRSLLATLPDLTKHPHMKRVLTEHQAQQITIDHPDLDPTQRSYMRENNINILLILPMKFQDRIGGLVEIQDSREKEPFTSQEISLAQLLANQAAGAIQNARLHAETEHRTQQLIVLRELDQAISTSLRLDDIYHMIAQHTTRLLTYDRMSITISEEDVMRIAYTNTVDDNALSSGTTLPLKNSAVGWVVARGQPLLSHDISTGNRFVEHERLAAQGLRSIMIIPLRFKGKTIGTWNLCSRQVGAYRPDDLQMAQMIADQLAITIENARLYQQARQEINERKRTEKALRQSEERFRQVVSSISDHIYVTKVTSEGQENQYISPNVEDLTGYSSEKLMSDWGFWPSSVIYPEDRAVAQAHAQQLIQGQGGEVEYRLARADGKIIWVRDSAKVEVGETSKTIYGVVGDITDRKQYERKLEVIAEVATALRTALTRADMLPIILDKLLELIPMAGAALDMVDQNNGETVFELARGVWVDAIGTRTLPGEGISGRVLSTGQPYINNQVQTVPNLIPPELNKDIQAIACVPLLVQVQFTGVLKPDAANNHSDLSTTIGVLWIGHKDQITPDIVQLLSAIGDIAANALYRAALFEALQRSVEELAQERVSLAQRIADRTAELSAANAELARAGRLKDEFLASMSHELRTPLNAILGMSEVLRLNIYGALNEEQLQALGHIEEGGRHLLELINDILDLSKIEAGKLELSIGPVDVNEVCQASLVFIKQTAHRKRIKVSSLYDNSVTVIDADDRRLKQILVNLLSNAVKFTPEGGRVGLEVEGDLDRGVVNFSIWDTGIGISKEDIERLFKPFVQIDSSLSRKQGGTGLGLSLVYRLAEMHGGCVTLESEPDQGSRFTVSLPWSIRRDERELSDDPRSSHRTDDLTTQQSPESTSSEPDLENDELDRAALILLAEDNETNIISVRDYLQIKGYQVVLARDGAEAIDRAREEKPNIILMDIQMPGMDGLEAIRHLRTDSKLANIPIIALTSLAMPGDRERCLAAGADEYLSKPVRLKQLTEMIERQLKDRETGVLDPQSI